MDLLSLKQQLYPNGRAFRIKTKAQKFWQGNNINFFEASLGGQAEIIIDGSLEYSALINVFVSDVEQNFNAVALFFESSNLGLRLVRDGLSSYRILFENDNYINVSIQLNVGFPTSPRSVLLTNQSSFKIGSNFLGRLHQALNITENQSLMDNQSVLNSLIPDNDFFTENDATRLEQFYGLITPIGATLQQRKQALIRKINHPGDLLARSNYKFLESQLRLAGFDVYVHENIPETPPSRLNTNERIQPHGKAITGVSIHGNTKSGSVFENCIANYIEEDKDKYFDIGQNFRASFYIGGVNLGDYADVDEVRKLEFRQLILKLKPVQTVGFLLINYI